MAKRPPTTRPKPTDTVSLAQPKTRKTRAAPATVAEPSPDEIRRRAYERYQQRGGNHGQHFDDWLEAEKELKSKK